MGQHFIGKKDSSAYHALPTNYDYKTTVPKQYRANPEILARNPVQDHKKQLEEMLIERDRQYRDILDKANDPVYMKDFNQAWKKAAEQSRAEITRKSINIDVRKNINDAHIATIMGTDDKMPYEDRYFHSNFVLQLEERIKEYRNSIITIVYTGNQDKNSKYRLLDVLKYDPVERTILGKKISIQLEGFTEEELRDYKPAPVTERLGSREFELKKGSANFNAMIVKICVAGFHPWATRYDRIIERRRKKKEPVISTKLRKILEEK